jgi:tetratricopeptide (TPR) repeat protein
MDNLDYIESYFASEPDIARTREFEKRIESDPDFAEEVAFYLSVLKVSRESSQSEKKQHLKEIYQKNQAAGARRPGNNSGTTTVRKLIYYMVAAAIVAGIVFGTDILISSASPQKLADRYEKEYLEKLGVTMSGRSDSLQDGLRLYNEGKPAEALIQFEKIIRSDSSNFTAKTYAGISALRLKEYDKALAWFEELETYSGLYANPALLYQALTMMERNQSGDEARVKQLLQRIVQNDLEGKETAQKWLKKLK